MRNMSIIEEIKDKYAKEYFYKDWQSLTEDKSKLPLDFHINSVSRIYANECIKASLDKASKDPNVHTEDDAVEALLSITHPKNIVLL